MLYCSAALGEGNTEKGVEDAPSFTCYLHILCRLTQATDSLYFNADFRPYVAGAILTEVMIDEQQYMDVPETIDCIRSAVSDGSVYVMLDYERRNVLIYAIGYNGYMIIRTPIAKTNSTIAKVIFYDTHSITNPVSGGWDLVFSGLQYAKQIDSYYEVTNKYLLSYLLSFDYGPDLLEYIQARLNGTLTGWGIDSSGNLRYYISGTVATGIQVIDNEIYLFDDEGTLYSGWLTAGSNKYYFSPEMCMSYAYLIDGELYCFNDDGTLFTNGWYTSASGAMMYANLEGKVFICYDSSRDVYYKVNEDNSKTDYQTLRLPEDITAVESEAFLNVGTQVIVVPPTCQAINEQAFANCKSLCYVILDENVTNVSATAFTNDQAIIIPPP